MSDREDTPASALQSNGADTNSGQIEDTESTGLSTGHSISQDHHQPGVDTSTSAEKSESTNHHSRVAVVTETQSQVHHEGEHGRTEIEQSNDIRSPEENGEEAERSHTTAQTTHDEEYVMVHKNKDQSNIVEGTVIAPHYFCCLMLTGKIPMQGLKQMALIRMKLVKRLRKRLFPCPIQSGIEAILSILSVRYLGLKDSLQ